MSEASDWPPKNGAIAFIEAWMEMVLPPVPVAHDTAQARYRLAARDPVREAKRKKVRIRVKMPSEPQQEARVEHPRESFSFFSADSR
jgi:hypothetical protein